MLALAKIDSHIPLNLCWYNYLDQAIKRDSSFAKKVKKLVILGGAFFSLGNVNPAAEANVSVMFSLCGCSNLFSNDQTHLIAGTISHVLVD